MNRSDNPFTSWPMIMLGQPSHLVAMRANLLRWMAQMPRWASMTTLPTVFRPGPPAMSIAFLDRPRNLNLRPGRWHHPTLRLPRDPRPARGRQRSLVAQCIVAAGRTTSRRTMKALFPQPVSDDAGPHMRSRTLGSILPGEQLFQVLFLLSVTPVSHPLDLSP